MALSDHQSAVNVDANKIDWMLQRYSRAVRLTAPRIAAETPGIAVEGYWIDEDLYYFAAERMEPSIGRMVTIPSIADCRANSLREVISLEALARLLSDHSGQSIDLEALSAAIFDMPDRHTLAVSLRGQDFVVDARRPCVTEARVSLDVPALYSPDGRYACFVKGHDLWLKQRHTETAKPLTTDGADHYCYGQQPETSLSAVSYRARPSPLGLWSRDSQWFLTHRIDERSLPELAMVQHAPPGGGRPVLHKFKYSLPDDSLPTATFVAIHVSSGRVLTFDGFAAPVMAFSPFHFRMVWFGGTDKAWFLRFDRYFKQADLICLDLAQGTGRIVLSEAAASGYLDLHVIMSATPNVRTMAGSDEVIWFSERDGWGHLYLYDGSTGRFKNRITSGEWLVREIVHVDETQRKVLFLACGVDPQVDPARRSLCSVNLDGSGFEVLLAHDGDVSVSVTEPSGLSQYRSFCPSKAQAGVSPSGRQSVVRYASVDRGNVTQIVDLRTRQGFVIASALPDSTQLQPRPFTAVAADGMTRLHGVMFFPSGFDESRRYPLIDYIYPGPQVTQQPQSFRSVSAAQAMALAELGFVTIMLDTRCMPFRRRSLHQIGYGELLEPQLADHAAVVRQLCERYPFIDGGRVGMIGFSGGGAATARALFDYGELFKVGVSCCGNHDSSVYTAIWSDKYRGPGNREAWAAQANGAAAYKLQGKLLLISADTDENVHVSHTLSLVDALVRANKDFDLLIVPNEGHYMLMTCGYAQRRVWDYFVQHLLGEIPPPNFEISFKAHELAHCTERLMREPR